MTQLLGTDVLAGRLAELRGGATGGAAEAGEGVQRTPSPRLIRRIADVLPSLIDVLLHRGDRIMLGLDAIDMRTRGFGAKELVFFTGFSHSGKTQLVNTMILNNLDKRIVFFSLDDPAEMILTKLAAMDTGLSGERIERELRDENPNMRSMLVDTCTRLSNLLIVDDNLGFDGIDLALAEATAMWGEPPQLVIVDYLELMPADDTKVDNGTKAKAQAFKRWVKSPHVTWPTVVLHQGTRSNAKPGEPITLLSMAYGGEQEATILIGCRRKRDNESLDSWERESHEHTVTLHVVKNKRPGGRLTAPDGIDFYLDPDTGLIAPLRAATPIDPEHEQLHWAA